MERRLRQLVRRRANHRCEYCQLREIELAEIAFHVEHIIALKHGGTDDPANLALACDRCNLHKGPNVAGIDPTTGQVTPLFHPRSDEWDLHFERVGYLIVGRTPVGRASAQVLELNSPRRIQLRQWLQEVHRHGQP